MTGDMYDLLEQNSTLYLYGALSNKPITIDTSILEETKKLKSLEILDWLDSMSVLKRYHVMRKIQKLYTKIFIVTYCVSVDFQGFKEALVAYRERKTNSKILLRIANYYN